MFQIKYGEDLAASIGDRLVSSIARMREVTRRIQQHWLLYVGTLGCDKEGSVLINGRRSHMNHAFATVNTALIDWMARGGMYYNLPHENLLEAWMLSFEANLNKYHAQGYRYALSKPEYPDDPPSVHDEVFQIPVEVKDARRALVGFRGLGPETVNKVWKHTGDFKAALMFLTDPSSAGVIEGIGAKTIASIRRQCGLSESDGYFGWERDAPVAPESRVRTKQELADDVLLLFGKAKVAP